MFKKILILAALVVGTALVSACGGSDDADSLAVAQTVTTANVKLNAEDWQAASSTYTEYTLAVQGDPAVTESCQQGSGYGTATLTLGTSVVTLYCSTTARTPCVTVQSETPGYGSCNSKLSYPVFLPGAHA